MRAIEDIHKASRGTYGSPRILAELKGLGFKCSKKRVERLMKKNGIRAKTPVTIINLQDIFPTDEAR